MTVPVVPKRRQPPAPPVLSRDGTVPFPLNRTLRIVTLLASMRITRPLLGAEMSAHVLGSFVWRRLLRPALRGGPNRPSMVTFLSGLREVRDTQQFQQELDISSRRAVQQPATQLQAPPPQCVPVDIPGLRVIGDG